MSDNWLLQVAEDRLKKYQAELKQLKAENERLKDGNFELARRVTMLEQSVAELQEALRKCSPFTEHQMLCRFCWCDEELHTDDCTWLRLCGGSDNE